MTLCDNLSDFIWMIFIRNVYLLLCMQTYITIDDYSFDITVHSAVQKTQSTLSSSHIKQKMKWHIKNEYENFAFVTKTNWKSHER